MGQKVNPKSQRIKVNELWKSRWFKGKGYSDSLIEDIKLRRMIHRKLKSSAVLDVLINRESGRISLTIYSARPGVIIGRGGSGIEKLKAEVEKFTDQKVRINIVEVKRPDTNAEFVAQNVAYQIEKRFHFRRAIKQAIGKAQDAGVKGIKIELSGRLNGADIARTEKSTYGNIPLSTLKSEIGYAYVPAKTTYGVVGVKVWVYQGEKDISAELDQDKEKA